MNKQKRIQRIGELLARFVAEVKIFNDSNLYDVNIHAENVIIPILNEVLGVRLENVNAVQKKNFPAIDLADFKGRVAFQVTSTASITKVNDTFDRFKDHQLQKHFDILYFYILTNRQDSYSVDSISKHLPDEFEFDPARHIIDSAGLLSLINNLSSAEKIDAIERILTAEFSEAKIELRRKEFEQKYLKAAPENIYTNLLRVEFPSHFFIADLNLNKDQATARLNDWLASKDKKARKTFKFGTLLGEELRHHKIFFQDYILHERKILTFRNLHDLTEPLRQIIDAGTITQIGCDEFYNASDDKLNVFKYLLKANLIQFAHLKEMEWRRDTKIIRFKKEKVMPRKKQKNWKGQKESTKTVIFEVLNKKLGHIICFRHLAFRPAFDKIGDLWFLVLNPTWSFTNPFNGKASRYEPYYMSGLKRMENNQAIYYFYRFFEYYLGYVDLFTTEYEFLSIQAVPPLSLSPSLDDEKWRPIKQEDISNLTTEGLEQDTELNPSLFD